METAIEWGITRLVAGILLCVYVAVALVQFGRESRFLAGVEMPTRGWFISQDLLIQLAVLLCLLPVALSPVPTREVLSTCLGGLTLLWLVGIWTVISRRVYTYRLLLGARGEHDKLIAELMKRRRDSAAEADNAAGQPENKDG